MQPEDIDKLFRERLQGHAPTPPAFLWAEIEAEMQPRRKRPVLWLAAAAVTLLTLLGGAWWVLTGSSPGRPGTREMAATTTRPTPGISKENISAPQATPTPASPSSLPEAQANKPAAVVATTAPSSEARSAGVQPAPASENSLPARPQASTAPAPRQLALASAPAAPTRPTLPERGPDPELDRPAELPTATVALTGPIEVEVRPGTEAAALAAAPTRRPRLTSLLRQARNAVKGERVSLTEAGLPESVTVQAHVAGRTLTKTIQL
ncbi:hypothetical protein K3G63_03935 [Hymenobacter sp. HSC-4F20]|uniref:hypothetical protein n=1 Tax=Hymenobacter sp. HSC-4F20 TaxID=2864135 RepID=UPI001C73A157|nr:hypothetical protein [Hymenobacter sp. HSC-4F20]MBX0289572.1 hypothetical protein [Hymenobacter sp. HSC-4F20]